MICFQSRRFVRQLEARAESLREEEKELRDSTLQNITFPLSGQVIVVLMMTKDLS